VRIDGVFKGEIKSDDTLVIGDGAEVHAEIDVATVIVRGGVVHGNIRAKTAIEVHAPGKIVGNLQSPSLFIDRGVAFEGSCRMVPIDGKSAGKPVAATSIATSPRA
jgi:cytoskeletal protein CcmA (bactofilin family)